MQMLLAVAAGGAFGAVLRYLTMGRVAALLGTGFPWGTLVVNVAGSFAMGLIVALGARAIQPSPELRALLTVGILGGFTTFSTFSLDTMLLIERGQWPQAALYAALSVLLSVAGLWAGMALVRQVV